MLTSSKEGISLAFVVGVFLSNFPEAMSSSIQMAKTGMTKYDNKGGGEGRREGRGEVGRKGEGKEDSVQLERGIFLPPF